MTGYFDRLDCATYPELYQFALEVGCDKKCPKIADVNIERVLLTLEQARTACALVLQGWFDQWSDKIELLRSQLGKYTISRLCDQIDLDSANWAVQLLAATGFQTTYISMNYDVIAESILSHRTGTRHCDGGNCPHCKMRDLLQHACL